MKEKAERLISKQINKHRQNIRRGWVQPADVARVEEKNPSAGIYFGGTEQ